MSQSDVLFNNQYHEDVVRSVFRELNDMSWCRAVEEQKTLCQSEWIGGPMTDFVQDEELNTRMKFPTGSYTTFIPRKIVNGYKAKTILDKYIIPKHLISIKDILVSPDFSFNYIFWIAEYVFMDLKVCLCHNGTYLVIENKASSGISDDKMKSIIANYNNEFCENRWCLEIRPRTSWMYTETNYVNLLTNLKIPQSIFLKKWFTIDRHVNKVWRLCVSFDTEEPNLMRMTNAKYTDDNQLEITSAFNEFLQGSSFNVKVFTYEEPFKVGYTVMPNIEGPTVYLKTVDDEYIADIDGRRLKVLATRETDDNWVSADGKDIKFTEAELEKAIVMGNTGNISWLSIPCKSGTSPVNPHNFRIWEYDADRDLFGRMNVIDPELVFPNIYTFQNISEEAHFYIEWIRDESVAKNPFLDFTNSYRKYIGLNYPIKKMAEELIPAIQNYQPTPVIYSDGDYITNPNHSCIQEYDMDKMKELLRTNRYGWRKLLNALARANAPFKVNTLKFSSNENWTDALESNATEIRFAMTSTTATDACDVYIDGKFIPFLKTEDHPWGKYLIIPLDSLPGLKESITPDSMITIIRYTTTNRQLSVYSAIDVHETIAETYKGRRYVLFPYDFKGESLSGSDITLYDSAKLRLDVSNFGFGMYAYETIIQYPTKMINWEKLGISKDDPEIQKRIHTDEASGMEVITFDNLSPNELSYLYLKTTLGELIMTLDPAYLVVKSGKKFIHREPGETFSKKVNPLEIAIEAPLGVDALGQLGIANSDVYRRVDKLNPTITDGTIMLYIDNFYGAADKNRFLVFSDGKLLPVDSFDVTFSKYVGRPATITIPVTDASTVGTVYSVVYLPYPVEHYTMESNGTTIDTNGKPANAGIPDGMIGYTDLIFKTDGETGLVPTTLITPIGEEISEVVPKYANSSFIVYRPKIDSNLWGFDGHTESSRESILDQLIVDDLDYADSLGVTI